MNFKWISNGDIDQINDALQIRRKVFIEEQSVSPELEIDGLDSQLIHVIAYNSNHEAVATARIMLKEDNTLAKLQRVAVLKEYRGQHVGYQLMQEIERWSRASHFPIKHLILSAQDTAIPFYEKLGYKITSPEGYLDANIPHHDMAKNL
ncbi:GNAT family N-acetyltransferase [Aerococcaceae bacterium WGS1372]